MAAFDTVGKHAIHLDADAALRAWRCAFGRVQQDVIHGRAPARSCDSLGKLTERMRHARVPFYLFPEAQGGVLVLGDVPGAPEIDVSENDGVERGTARTARIRFVAEVEGIDRDERIEQVRGEPDAARILALCAPHVLAAHRIACDVARYHVERLRENVDRYYAGEIAHDLFCIRQRVVWQDIERADERTRVQVKRLLSTAWESQHERGPMPADGRASLDTHGLLRATAPREWMGRP